MKIFLAIYVLVFIVCAIEPADQAVWWAENIPMLLVVAGVWITHRYHQFSRTSFIMMGFLVVLHTIGGHYTFEHVPFGLITETFSFERNHFDRVAHFSVGFYAYPIAELLHRQG